MYEEITIGLFAAENNIKVGNGQRDNLPLSTTSRILYQRLIYLKILIKHVNGNYNEKLIKKIEIECTSNLKAKVYL